MFWFIVLMILVLVFIIVAIGTFIIFLLSGCEVPEVLLVTLIAGVIAFALALGAISIENKNTTIDTDVVQMEITKCEIANTCSNSESMQQNYYITVGNKYLIKVGAKEYAELNVGDIVMVEITTKTVFGEAQKPTITLKG